MFCEISDELVHDAEIRGIDELSAVARLRDETGAMQLLKVKGQGRRWHLEPRRDRAGIQALRTRLDEHPVDAEPVRVRERGHGVDSL